MSNHERLLIPDDLIINNDEETLVAMLESGQVNIDAPLGISNENALYLAAGYGHVNLVNILLSYGANPDVENQNGRTAMHAAVFYEESAIEDSKTKHKNAALIVDRLLRAGAAREKIIKRDWEGRVQKKDFINDLVDAARRDKNDFLWQVLLSYGANPYDYYGSLSVPEEDEHSIIRFNNALRSNDTNELRTALVEASINLANTPIDCKGTLPLFFAMNENGPESAEILLQAGANPNAEFENDSLLHLQVKKGRLDCIELLLRYGARPDIKDANNQTPLYHAIYNNHVDIAERLLLAGATVHELLKLELFNLTDDRIYNLYRSNYENDMEKLTAMFVLLLSHGAKPWGKTSKSLPLSQAYKVFCDEAKIPPEQYEKTLSLLQETELSLRALKKAVLSNDIADVTDIIRKAPLSIINTPLDHKGATALYLATSSEMIRCLSQNGAKANSPRPKDRLKLFALVNKNHDDCLRQFAESYPRLVNQTNEAGLAPLHVAALLGREEGLKILLDRGAKLEITDNKGRTALHYAAKFGNSGIVALLLQRGANRRAQDIKGKIPLDLAQDKTIKIQLTTVDISATVDRQVQAASSSQGSLLDTAEIIIPALQIDKPVTSSSGAEASVEVGSQMTGLERNKYNFKITENMIRQGLVSNIAGNLQITLVDEHGDPLLEGYKQPLKANSRQICNLGAINLPMSYGEKTLEELVNNSLEIGCIAHEPPVKTALFTSVVAAVPGKHTGDESACTAQLIPLINAGEENRFMMVHSFPLNGDMPLSTDTLFINSHYPESCMGWSNKAIEDRRAYKVTELPDTESASELDSRIAVVCIEFELKMPDIEHPWESTGGPMTVQQSTGGGFSNSRVSAGSCVNDNRVLIEEHGVRILKNVHVYLVDLKIVNPHTQLDNINQHCYQQLAFMKREAEQLKQFCLPFIALQYNDLVANISRFLLKYRINTFNTDIFEHAILRLAGVEEVPALSQYYQSKAGSQYFCMAISMSVDDAAKVVHNLQQRFGTDICTLPDEQQGSMSVIQFSLSSVKKCLPAILNSMDSILHVPGKLLEYQSIVHQKQRASRTLGVSVKSAEQLLSTRSELFPESAHDSLHAKRKLDKCFKSAVKVRVSDEQTMLKADAKLKRAIGFFESTQRPLCKSDNDELKTPLASPSGN